MSENYTQYALGNYTLFDKNILPIDNVVAGRLAWAKQCLVELMCFEEKYDILLNNYLELEGELVSPNLVFRACFEEHELFDIKAMVNRRLANVLSSCRMYIDHVKSAVLRMSRQLSLGKNIVDEAFSRVYDDNQSYRIMEAVRNFSQHFELPIEKIFMNMSMDSDSQIAMSINIHSSLDYFKECKKFKRSTLDEIESLGSDVDIKKATREYVDGISKVHLYLRDLFKVHAEGCDTSIKDAVESYKTTFGIMDDDKIPGFSIIELGPSGKRLSYNFLLGHWTDRRKKFERKNSLIQNIHLRYVSGKVEIK